MTTPHREQRSTESAVALLPYAEVARMDLERHRRRLGSRVCRSCKDPWPCARHLEVAAVLGRRPGMRGWWLAGPVVLGVFLIAAAAAGVVPW